MAQTGKIAARKASLLTRGWTSKKKKLKVIRSTEYDRFVRLDPRYVVGRIDPFFDVAARTAEIAAHSDGVPGFPYELRMLHSCVSAARAVRAVAITTTAPIPF